MKAYYSVSITCLLLILLSSSCKKNVSEAPIAATPPVSADSLTKCHLNNVWDSASIANHLLGKWQWEFIKCYWNPEDANSKDYQGLTIQFKPGQIAEVKQQDVISQTATWRISPINDNTYQLITTPLIVQLPGKIYICDNRVLFSDTYTDGCDNFFKKIP
jgi:hypothetical protein